MRHKKQIRILVFGIALLGFTIRAEKMPLGKKLFKAKGCIGCHNPTTDQIEAGLGPSILTIAKAYAGDRAGLLNFLKGSGKPRVFPEKIQVMRPMQEMIRGLPENKIESLADFILGQSTQ